MRRLRRKLMGWTTKILDIPQDITLDLPRITMIGNVQMYVENHRGVIHFSNEMLKLGLANGHLEVHGKDLVIRAILTEEVFIEGTVREVRHIP